MENKFLKAAVFAMMLGVAGSAMASGTDIDKLILNPYTDFSNTDDGTSNGQTVFGSNNSTSGFYSSAYGYKNEANGTNTTAIGNSTSASNTSATAVGSYVSASGQYSLALGAGSGANNQTTASGNYSIAMGYKTAASQEHTVALGSEASAGAADAVAIGKSATATTDATDGLALGTSSSVAAVNATAIGTSSYAASQNAMAIGNGSRVSTGAANALAIGTNAYVKVENAIAIGKDAAVSAAENNPTDNVVSFGHTDNDTYYDAQRGKDVAYSSAQTSRLINVTAGYQDTDATNFSQIKTEKPTYTTGSTSYIQSSLDTDGKTLNAKGTVGANLAALDAKMVATKTATVNTVDLGTTNNQIVSNDGTVLATFKKGTLAEGTSLTATDFVSNGDVYAAIAARAQKISLSTATNERDKVNNKDVAGNTLVSNDGEVLATFESEKPSSLSGKKFVTSGDVFAADVKSGQEVTLDSETTRDTVNTKEIKGNEIASNEGTVLARFKNATYAENDKGFVSGGLLWSQSIAAGQTPSFATDNNVIKNNNEDVLVTFTEGVAAVTKGETAKSTIDDVNFISARNAYANDVAYAQTFTLDGNNVSGNFVTNAGATVGTVNITRGSVAEGNIGFVTGDDVWQAIAKYNQTIDFSKVDTSTNSNTATNDTVLTGDEGGNSDTTGEGDTTGSDGDTTGNDGTTGEGGSEAGGEGDTTGGGTTGGDTTGGDSGSDDSGSSDQGGSDSGDSGDSGDAGNPDSGDSGDSGETTEQFSNKIYANDGTVIATFKQAEIKENDTGFATGGQVYGQALEENQTVSFDDEKNIIKNNAGTTLVTFTKAEVAEDNTGFATGGQVWSNAIAAGQEISFEDGKNAIQNNAGEDLVTFKSGEAKEGDTGFVSGDAAWKGDVKEATLKLESGKDAVIQNNNGDDLVTIQHGKVEEGNTGFVSGGDVYENTKNIKADISKEIDAVDKRVDQTEQQISSLGGKVSDVENRVEKVGAGAAALAALHPLDYDPNAKLTFAVGYGNYRSTSAAAIGAFIRPNNRFMWSIGATLGNGENMYNTGLSFAIGSGKGIRMSRAELDFKVGQISEQMTQMEAERQIIARDNAQQDAAILDLHARLQKVEQILAQLTK